MIRALPCTDVVITPAWEPVNDRAVAPSDEMAMATSALEIRSPEVSNMSSSRGCGVAGDILREPQEIIGRVAHGGHHDDDVVSGIAGGHDPLGDPLDPVGVLHRRAAVLLHDQAHRPAPRAAAPRGGSARTGPHAALTCSPKQWSFGGRTPPTSWGTGLDTGHRATVTTTGSSHHRPAAGRAVAGDRRRPSSLAVRLVQRLTLRPASLPHRGTAARGDGNRRRRPLIGNAGVRMDWGAADAAEPTTGGRRAPRRRASRGSAHWGLIGMGVVVVALAAGPMVWVIGEMVHRSYVAADQQQAADATEWRRPDRCSGTRPHHSHPPAAPTAVPER